MNLAMVLVAVPPASAADEHAHAAKHGGQFIEVEGHHGIEMVATSEALVFYLTEEDKPVDLTGAQFKAVVQSDDGTATIALAVEGGALSGKLKAPLPVGAKIVITGKDRHGHALQARFVKK